MERFNICTKKVFQSKGEERVQWNQVGTLVHFPATPGNEESYILELHMHPETKFYVFKQEIKEPEPPKAPLKPVRR